jgi:hypothetical protein
MSYNIFSTFSYGVVIISLNIFDSLVGEFGEKDKLLLGLDILISKLLLFINYYIHVIKILKLILLLKIMLRKKIMKKINYFN